MNVDRPHFFQQHRVDPSGSRATRRLTRLSEKRQNDGRLQIQQKNAATKNYECEQVRQLNGKVKVTTISISTLMTSPQS